MGPILLNMHLNGLTHVCQSKLDLLHNNPYNGVQALGVFLAPLEVAVLAQQLNQGVHHLSEVGNELTGVVKFA